MTRILLVDDEPLILRGLQRRLKREAGFEVFTAPNVDGAVRVLEREGIDVLLTDLRMPGRDGAELLAEVVERWPHVVRVVMSGHLGRSRWDSAVPHAQAVLHKPASSTEIRDQLRRAAGVQDRFNDPRVLEALGAVEGLPSAPDVYRRLGELAHDPSVGLAAVASVVEADPAIAAQVLRVANSAWLGLPRQVSDLRDALNFLGIDLVRRLTLTAEVFAGMGRRAALAGVDLSEVQRDASLTAHLAAHLAPIEGRAAASTAGLLHDVGVLALASAQPERWAAARALVAGGASEQEAELDTFGCTHGTAGAILLHRWGLPLEIVDAVAFHDEPRRSGRPGLGVSGAVYLGARLAVGAMEGQVWVPKSSSARIDLGWLESTGRSEDLPRWRRLAESLVRADD